MRAFESIDRSCVPFNLTLSGKTAERLLGPCSTLPDVSPFIVHLRVLHRFVWEKLGKFGKFPHARDPIMFTKWIQADFIEKIRPKFHFKNKLCAQMFTIFPSLFRLTH